MEIRLKPEQRAPMAPCVRNTSYIYKSKQTLGHHDLQLLNTLLKRSLLPGVLTIHMVHLLL